MGVHTVFCRNKDCCPVISLTHGQVVVQDDEENVARFTPHDWERLGESNPTPEEMERRFGLILDNGQIEQLFALYDEFRVEAA